MQANRDAPAVRAVVEEEKGAAEMEESGERGEGEMRRGIALRCTRGADADEVVVRGASIIGVMRPHRALGCP